MGAGGAAARARIQGIVIALAEEDAHWPAVPHRCARAHRAPSRFGPPSAAPIGRIVMNGLKALEGHAEPQDWILVHDAAGRA